MLRTHSLLSVILAILIFSNIYSHEILKFDTARSDDLRAAVNTAVTSASNAFLSFEIPAVHTFPKIAEGQNYTAMMIEGFGNITDIGHPALPAKSFHMALGKGKKCDYTIIESEVEVLEGTYDIHPALELYKDLYQGEGVPDEEPPFVKEASIYNKNAWYPESPVFVSEIQVFRGTPVAILRVVPVQYNPITQKVRVYKSLSLKIETDAGLRRIDNSITSSKILNNLTLNGYKLPAAKISERADLIDNYYDYLILTVPDFEPAAESLAVWKMQMGYDVKIDSRDSWTSGSVNNAVKSFYEDNNKPEYVLFLGDNGQIPGEVLDADHTTDLYYVCMDGSSDYRPDMARGRIPVNSIETAFTVVNKILKYERDPVRDQGFYSRFTACAQFQDDDKNGYADRRFSLTAEDMILYMQDHGYETERIYKTSSSINPTNWNSGSYAFGQPIPSYLKKPGFPWDGDRYDIRNAVNNGTFLLLHRDHGYTSGWGTPSYNSNDIEDLSNGDKTPVVFSINCLTGKFKSKSFAEVFIRKNNGGAVGVFAAMEVSFSGTNDAYTHGLFDAIYPGTEIYSPKNTTVNPEDHDPIYNLGDVMVHGLWAMERANYYSKKTHELMHYFGDPAMEIRTAAPIQITASHLPSVNVKDNSFDISGMNITNGYATLFDRDDKEILGKVKVNGSSATINLKKALDKSDNLVLTICSHNYIPYIQEIEIIANPSTFVITKPEKGELFDVGDTVVIDWTTEGVSVSNVKISFSKDHGINFSSVVNSTPNSGSYKFIAPEGIDSEECYFKLVDAANSESNNLSKSFSIYNISDVSGTVTEMIPATVYYTGADDGSVESSGDGSYRIDDMYPGNYSFYAVAKGYSSDTLELQLPADTSNFNLRILFPQIDVLQSELNIKMEPLSNSTKMLTVKNIGTKELDYKSFSKMSTAQVLINELFLPHNAFLDGVEIWNRGDEIDMSGWKLVWTDNTETSGEYEFEDGFRLSRNGTAMIMDDESLVNANSFFMGLNVAWTCEEGTELSVALINENGMAVDFVRTSEGSNILPEGAFWNGDGLIIDSTTERYYRNDNDDNDNASDWSGISGEASINSINSGQSEMNSSFNWIFLENDALSVNVAENKEITVNINSASLSKGVYKDTLILIHNAPNIESPVLIPVNLTVKDLIKPEAKDLNIETDQDQNAEITLQGTDVDGSIISYKIESEPGNGEINLENGVVTYSPPSGYIGTDTFQYSSIDDDSLVSEAALVTVKVLPIVAIVDDGEIIETTAPFLVGPNPASISKEGKMSFIVKNSSLAGIVIKIYDYQNNLIDSFNSSDPSGNVYSWDLRNKNGRYVAQGKYLATIKITERDGNIIEFKQYLGVVK